MSKKSKSTNAAKSGKSTATPSATSGKKYLIGALALAVVAVLAYYFFGRDGKTGGGPSFKRDNGSEPTLTAASPRLQLLSPGETGVDFQNLIVETEEHNVIRYINEYNGGGVAVADINNDQLPDLYFVCTTGKNKLYLNEGNFKFKDITDAAGVGSEDGFETAVTAADVNADGWLDFYVCRAGLDKDGSRSAKLFINNQNLTFTEKSAEYGLNDKSPATCANFFDADLDGDLDCYLVNHPTDLTKINLLKQKYAADGKTRVADLSPTAQHDSDNFYRNDNGKFVNASKEAGIQNLGFGLSASVTDLNQDGWPDVYVANDFIQPDNLFINNQKGGFNEQLRQYFRHCTMSSMGTDLSDFDNDGLVDLFAMDMLPATNYRQKSIKTSNTLSVYLSIKQYGYFEVVTRNALQRNNGNGTFSDVACLGGVYKTDWSWSGLLADLDNDGQKDLHIANGYRRDVTNHDYQNFLLADAEQKRQQSRNKDWQDLVDFIPKIPAYKVRNFVYQNKGNWQFEDKSGDWMTMPGSWSSGSAWADLDADGDLDLVVNNIEDPAFVYKNLTREQGGGNYLQAKLQGAAGNPFAVGTSVLIEYQGNKQYQELNPSHGLFSSVEHLIHFGLGQTAQIDRLTVRWPDGKFQVISNVPVNQRLQLKHSDASGYIKHLSPAAPSGQLFNDRTAGAGIQFQHRENPFNDFETWLLNPWMETEMTPLIAQGDLNGDGLEDFFVGNAFESPSAIYLQNANGSFRASSTALFEKEKIYEDHGGVFLDADGDKDLDLFVTGGGADATSAAAWQCRLYLNDGKGEFAKANFGPTLKDMALRTVAFDYDGDGDQDLFVGGRLTPNNWPLTPRSHVFRNDGSGRYSDATAQVAGEFERCGMVTDLAWSDLNGDGQQELVVVGEWMPVSVFQLKNGKLENATAQFGLDKTNGLWNRLLLADLDKDGDMDLVTGNLGLNTRFTASVEAPLLCYAKDFDNNGTLDPVVAIPENGKHYPMAQKDLLVKQMPGLKKRYLYATDYAQASMEDIWPKKDLEAAFTTYCYELRSVWWENQNGKFVRHELPVQAQVSPVFGIICDDFNRDGHPDLLLAGNKYGYEVETGRCDAGNGVLLIGDGKGQFTYLDNLLGGFWAMGEVRDLAQLRGAGGKKWVLVANNNGKMQVYGQ
ncbi:MAG: VCBS repeat-containing protein [Saprospiraceae bacterium]|nr:VCBS repeat-containing protein [Saprospiraceae bacterium]